ncbi:unnamed protein product, partial [Adineta ricciae]
SYIHSHPTSSSLAKTVRYIDPLWYDGRGGEEGNVCVRSCRVTSALGLGVHHAIAVDNIDDKWRVFEWGTGSNKRLSSYATDRICGQNCVSLGRHKLSDVYRAVQQASTGEYSASNNCNIWTERVAALLGHRITVHWNCSCVL